MPIAISPSAAFAFPMPINIGITKGAVGGRNDSTRMNIDGSPPLSNVWIEMKPTSIGMLNGNDAFDASDCRDTSDPTAAYIHANTE